MSDETERSVASAGSVEPVAWAAFLNGELDSAFKSQADAFMWAYKRDGISIVPLYRQPQDGVVRLPRLLWDLSEKMGKGEWDYQQRVKAALEVAGVKWVEIE